MPEVIYVEHDGTRHQIEVPIGTSIMHGAVNLMVPGIEGDCGGLCACATCHVYIPKGWAEQCGIQSELEANMIQFAFNVDDRSRLSCQIKMSDELSGLIVYMPERQY